jgi:phosphotransferase system HPr (HPr) family protein
MVETVVLKAKVVNVHGIHARPSHAIVSAAVDFEATIELHCDGRVADARSILSVMTLGAGHGAEIEVHASGPQAEQAATRVVEILASAEA